MGTICSLNFLSLPKTCQKMPLTENIYGCFRCIFKLITSQKVLIAKSSHLLANQEVGNAENLISSGGYGYLLVSKKDPATNA